MASRTRILLFGAGGQIGSALAARLGGHADLVALRRADVDLENSNDVATAIRTARPALVINAAAFTAVDSAEREEAAAMRVNADAPAAMAKTAAECGAAIVHFSTDYVFGGDASRPYRENDPPSPLGAYGRSKLAGDVAVASAGAPFLVFRTSWVYAAHGRNFLRAILARAETTGHLRVVNDQVGAPTSADAIADAVVAVLGKLEARGGTPAAAISGVSGIYNMSAAGETTWYDFAVEILRSAGIAATIEPITTQEFGAPAPRPRYSLLDNEKLRRTFGVTLPEWRAQLAALDAGRWVHRAPST